MWEEMVLKVKRNLARRWVVFGVKIGFKKRDVQMSFKELWDEVVLKCE